MVEFMTTLVNMAQINFTRVIHYSEIHMIQQMQTDHSVTPVLNNVFVITQNFYIQYV